MIRKRAERTGDGSNKYSRCIDGNGVVRKEHLEHHADDSMVWGWDDKDMNDEDKEDALIIKKTEWNCRERRINVCVCNKFKILFENWGFCDITNNIIVSDLIFLF